VWGVGVEWGGDVVGGGEVVWVFLLREVGGGSCVSWWDFLGAGSCRYPTQAWLERDGGQKQMARKL